MGKISEWRGSALAGLKHRYRWARSRMRVVMRTIAGRVRLAANWSAYNPVFKLGWSFAGVGGFALSLEHLIADTPWLMKLGLGLVALGAGTVMLVCIRYLILGEPESVIVRSLRLGGAWGYPDILIRSAIDTQMMRARLSGYVGTDRRIQRPSSPVEIPWSTGRMREPFAPGDAGWLNIGKWRISYDEACVIVGVRRLIVPVCGIEIGEGVFQMWLEIEFTAQGARTPQRLWFSLTVSLDDDGEIVSISGGQQREPFRRILRRTSESPRTRTG